MKWFLAVFGTALTLMAHGELDAQIEVASRTIAADPANALHYVRRGELYRLHRDWTAAMADFEQAARRDAGDPAYLLGRARVHFDRGQTVEAVEALNRYLGPRPDSEVAFALRAQCYSRLGKHKLAAADFAAAIRVSREPQPDYFLDEAQALAAAGDEIGALTAVDGGLARLGPLPALEQWAIKSLASRGRHAEALKRLDAVIVRAGRKETLLAQRGDLLLSAGRVSEAREAYRGALAALEKLPERARQTRAMTELHARLVNP